MKNKKSILYLLIIFGFLIILKMPNLNRSEFWVYCQDESKHAMNGIFILDFIKDKGYLSPRAYIEKYFVKYPALSLQRNPPLFYFIEALFLYIFGISVKSVQLSMIFFIFIGIYFWFKLLQKKYDSDIAFLSCLLLINLHGFLFYYNSIMLEVPIMSIFFVFLFYFDEYYETRSAQKKILCFIILLIAFLISQKAFLLVIFTTTALLAQKLMFKKNERKIIKLGLAVAAVFIIYYLGATAVRNAVKDNRFLQSVLYLDCLAKFSEIFSLERIVYYAKSIPKQIGFATIILLATGIYALIKNREYKKYSLLILFITCVYILQLFILRVKDDRFTFYAIPVFALVAVRGLIFLEGKTKLLKYKKRPLLLIFTILFIIHGYSYKKPFIRGFDPLANYIIKNNSMKNPVLININYWHIGNFIFFIRKYDTDKKNFIIRSEKYLYSFRGLYKYANTCAMNPEEILNRIDEFNIRYIVIDINSNIDVLHEQNLLGLLRDQKRFRVVFKKKIETNLRSYVDKELKLVNINHFIIVYEYLFAKAPTHKRFYLEIPYIKKNITIEQ